MVRQDSCRISPAPGPGVACSGLRDPGPNSYMQVMAIVQSAVAGIGHTITAEYGDL